MYPDKSELIYLTNDSPNELDHLDDSKTYVIGGIVGGRNRQTIQKAEKLGIATARLPVEKYVNANSTNLHIDHLFEVLLKYRGSNNDWKRAMLNVIPTRKESLRICIDCSFESTMPEHSVYKLVYQLQRCYYANKRFKNRVLYSVCSLGGKTNELLTTSGDFPSWNERAFNSSEKSLTEMYPDKSELIYLTNDSPNELDHLDDSKTYVIGGIVGGRNRQTIQKAEKLGIATARLPVEKYVNANSTNLHIKRVFEILLKYRESNNDWKTAMLSVIPTRKDIKDDVKENEGTINVKENEDTMNIEENEDTMNDEDKEDTTNIEESEDTINVKENEDTIDVEKNEDTINVEKNEI